MWGQRKERKGEAEELAHLDRVQLEYSRREEARNRGYYGEDAGEAVRSGIQYYVDGKQVTYGRAMYAAEDGRYMAEYITGKGGRLKAVKFRRIEPN